MVNTEEYNVAKPKPYVKNYPHLSNNSVNFNDPIVKNKLILLSCLLISWLFFLIAIAGANSGMFRASVKSNGKTIEYACGWSNCRDPTFRDLYDVDNELASSGGFFGFVIVIAWIFTFIASVLICFHLWYNVSELFKIKNTLIHYNHIIFYGIMTVEILLIIAIVLFHSEFAKFIDENYSKYKWWPTWGMWFTYFAFILLIVGQLYINNVIIEQDSNKEGETVNIKPKASNIVSISNNNNNNSSNNNKNNNHINNINNINNVKNINNSDNIKDNADVYDSDDEELGIKLAPHNDTNVIDIEIDDREDRR